MSEQTIIELAKLGIPLVVFIITAIQQRRLTEKHAAKQSILQMILEDKQASYEGNLPTNYQNILHEYDIYHKNGGNSYVTEKVEEYKKWFARLQADHIDK